MANFNGKVMSLFKDTSSQLYKECRRRGIESRGKSKEEIIANIIWKNAYDAGVNDGKHLLTRSQIAPTKMYRFHDDYSGVNYRISINKDQVNAIQWVIDTLNDPAYELTEWNNDFVDVGRI